MKQLTFFALLALSACATAAAPAPTGRLDWHCTGGAAFSVRYVSGQAEVFAGGQVYHLPSVEAPSGARYSNGRVDYNVNGSSASLGGAAGGPYGNCRRG